MTASAYGYGRTEMLSTAGARPLALADAYLRLHAGLLVGYALAGKGFAYLGFPPLYLGEISLVLGVVVCLLTRTLLYIPLSPPVFLLLVFQLWCAALAVFDLGDYGVDCMRDSAIWGYGLFALLVAGIVSSRPTRLLVLLRRYQRFVRIFLVAIPGIWLLCLLNGEALPRAPGTDVPIIHAKAGDVLVHLAGIGAFLLVSSGRIGLRWPMLLSLAFALTAVRSRGGLLAFALGMGVVAFARPLLRRLWIGTASAAIGVFLLLSVDPGISMGGRELSLHQLVANVTSTFSPSGAITLDGPRRWRIEWWSEIVDYTVNGPYFLTGKGFGINLATEDGFEVDPERKLRSPHNGHLTMLARAGVPGFLLWVMLQLAWLREMRRRYRRSRSAGQYQWSRLFLFLIAYWLAFLVNAGFDVTLEGPMAGIWFWTVFGAGLAAARIHQRYPALLEVERRAPAALQARDEGVASIRAREGRESWR